ncbi:MAG: NAD(P)H-hydrate dehydratase [Bryobacteraceae bacterium]|nr:NAD(P)H-hydrate dehydratase [Bryobacteraceae bacterium]
MKVLTAAEMREIDRLTIEAGIPGIVLMENAAHRVVEFLEREYAPLAAHRIVVICGKGNNGGDGLAIARQLHTRTRAKSLDVVLAAQPEELQGDAATNLQMLEACGCPFSSELAPHMQQATLVIDAVLGTGVRGAAQGRALEMITAINSGFPNARVVAVDLPSGMNSDAGDNDGPSTGVDATVTFTAPKLCHVLAPNCDRVGKLVVAPIGTPATMLDDLALLWLSLVEPQWFAPLFQPRPRASHKGNFGHVLVVAGSVGKTGAAAMAGISALRSGAGLVSVATAASALPSVAAAHPELMTEPLPQTETGAIASRALPQLEVLAANKSILALGPGVGTHADSVALVKSMYERLPLPMVVDADGLNAIPGPYIRPGGPRILTPHPGEMARLSATTTEQVQADRIHTARNHATHRGVTVVLKGQRMLIAFPDGRVWINPTGTPAMATAGSGDILTGLIAGLMAQCPAEADYAIGAAVWLHGRAGELGAAKLGEKCLIATDLLEFLPEAMRELSVLHHA